MLLKFDLILVLIFALSSLNVRSQKVHSFPSIVNQVRNSSLTNIKNSTLPNINLSENTRIIGGVETARYEFPFIVSFARQGKHFCGGAIIAAEWVLSAAHCAAEPDFTVTAGEHNLEVNEGTEQVSRAIGVIRHPSYNPVTFEDDICLVKVSPPFSFNDFVKPFVVPSTHFVANGNVTVAGWGTEDEVYQAVSPVLRKVTVPIVVAMDCAKQYGKNFIPHKMICAGEEEGGKDACQGDSGGPLMCDDYHKGATLCGIVSFGLGCARPDLAGVYTKVAYFSDWIGYEIKKNEERGPVPQKTTETKRVQTTTRTTRQPVPPVAINSTSSNHNHRPPHHIHNDNPYFRQNKTTRTSTGSSMYNIFSSLVLINSFAVILITYQLYF